MKLNEYILLEFGDKIYDVRWANEAGDTVAYFRTDNNIKVAVYFSAYEDHKLHTKSVGIAFKANDSYNSYGRKDTGHGIQTMNTILHCVTEYIKTNLPDYVHFSASKSDKDVERNRVNNTDKYNTRGTLYATYIKRLANKFNYTYKIDRGMSGTSFALSRKDSILIPLEKSERMLINVDRTEIVKRCKETIQRDLLKTTGKEQAVWTNLHHYVNRYNVSIANNKIIFNLDFYFNVEVDTADDDGSDYSPSEQDYIYNGECEYVFSTEQHNEEAVCLECRYNIVDNDNLKLDILRKPSNNPSEFLESIMNAIAMDVIEKHTAFVRAKL